MASVQEQVQNLVDQTLERVWQDMSVKDIVANQNPVVIDSRTDVVDACLSLAEHKISSAPIVDVAERRMVGMFDFRDMCAEVVSRAAEVDSKIDGMNDAKKLPLPWTAATRKDRDLVKLLKREDSLLATNASKHDHFYSVNDDETLLQAVPLFGQGVHRVCALDDQGNFKGVVSQSDALAHLARYINEESVAPLMGASIRTLGLADPRPVATIPESATVLDAIKFMVEQGVTSAPVVDKSNKLMSVISTTDIKYLFQSDRLALLHVDLHQFAMEIRLMQQAANNFKATVPVFSCRADMPLGQVVARLAATRAHRLWVHDDDNNLRGVVTLSDVLRLLSPKKHQAGWKDFVPAH